MNTQELVHTSVQLDPATMNDLVDQCIQLHNARQEDLLSYARTLQFLLKSRFDESGQLLIFDYFYYIIESGTLLDPITCEPVYFGFSEKELSTITGILFNTSSDGEMLFNDAAIISSSDFAPITDATEVIKLGCEKTGVLLIDGSKMTLTWDQKAQYASIVDSIGLEMSRIILNLIDGKFNECPLLSDLKTIRRITYFEFASIPMTDYNQDQ